jgi:DNA polymerase IV
MHKDRLIVHIDMDAFFASIEQRDNPKLRLTPVIIGADPNQGKGRGVVSTCSYEARVFGIHSAMPISMAYSRCPHGTYISPRMDVYLRESKALDDIFYSFTPDIEKISIDEAFLDITGTAHLHGSAEKLCRNLKTAIYKKSGLTASIGLAPLKYIAKIASDLEKPDGFVMVSPDEILDFLKPLDVKKICGIGKQTLPTLYERGINSIGDLQKWTKDQLTASFGSTGDYLYAVSRGIVVDSFDFNPQVKSISHEHTFSYDTDEEQSIAQTLIELCEKVSFRMRHDLLKAKTITLKIRLTGFKTYTRSITLPNFTNYVEDLYSALYNLYTHFDRSGKKVRLIGVKVSNFADSWLQEDIFDQSSRQKREKMYRAIDQIKSKYGNDSIFHAASKITYTGS